MGWLLKLRQKGRELCRTCTTLKELFQLTTISLLGLLLPLSFLLFARLSCAHFPFNLSSQPTPTQTYIFPIISYYSNLTLYALVSIVTLATLVQCLTGKINLLSEATTPAFKPRLFIAWLFLCTLQLCVGVGIEGSISAGVKKLTFGAKRSFGSRIMFFLGMHETMLHWCIRVVKPVADETIFGVAREDRWIERVGMGMSFGSVWWWRLRDEVEAMVVVPDVKKELNMALETADFVNWWLYYLTLTIGIVRVVKSTATIFLSRSDTMNSGEESEPHHKV